MYYLYTVHSRCTTIRCSLYVQVAALVNTLLTCDGLRINGTGKQSLRLNKVLNTLSYTQDGSRLHVTFTL